MSNATERSPALSQPSPHTTEPKVPEAAEEGWPEVRLKRLRAEGAPRKLFMARDRTEPHPSVWVTRRYVPAERLEEAESRAKQAADRARQAETNVGKAERERAERAEKERDEAQALADDQHRMVGAAHTELEAARNRAHAAETALREAAEELDQWAQDNRKGRSDAGTAAYPPHCYYSSAYDAAAHYLRSRLASLPSEPQGEPDDADLIPAVERCRTGEGSLEDYKAAFAFADNVATGLKRTRSQEQPPQGVVLSEEDREELRRLAHSLKWKRTRRTDAEARFLRNLADRQEGE